jgi:hypothetical protein
MVMWIVAHFAMGTLLLGFACGRMVTRMKAVSQPVIPKPVSTDLACSSKHNERVATKVCRSVTCHARRNRSHKYVDNTCLRPVGSWVNNNRHGWGVQVEGKTRYEGEWRVDHRHGPGIVTLPSGERLSVIYDDGRCTSGSHLPRKTCCPSCQCQCACIIS